MSEEGFPVGSAPVATAEFRVSGVLSDPGAVTVTIENPAGVQTTPTPLRVSTGIYAIQWTADVVGLWHYRFVGTAPVTGVVEGDVNIVPSPVVGSTPAYTYDLATNIGKVRLYIDDRDFSAVSSQTPREQRSAIFDDGEIAQFLAAEGDRVYKAAAVALTTIANNRGLLVQRRDLDGASVDYGSLRKDLMDSAQRFLDLDADAEGGDVAPADGIAEVNWEAFSERRIVTNAQLRQGY